MKHLLITDLDNTLYDWVTYFARSLRAMVDELVPILDVDRERLLDEIQEANRRLGTIEHPFSVFELPSVAQRYGPTTTTGELKDRLDPALHAFNRERQRSLRLYPGVADTLRRLGSSGVLVVGHTESSLANAFYRLSWLGIEKHFQHLYVLESQPVAHPNPIRQAELQPPAGMVTEIPLVERKPNPSLLQNICRREGMSPEESVFVGDSRTKDIFMAKQAGVTAVLAKYGASYSTEDWSTLVRVTNWTDEDVRQEESLRATAAGIVADVELGSFAELLPLFGIKQTS